MILAWSAFAVCGALILIAGSQLSREADQFADATGLSRSFVGLLLLATVTSIPEMVTGISAAAFVEEPNLAVGNVLGACVVNLVVLGMLDVLRRGESVYTRASQGHILSAGFGVIMIGFVGFNVLLGERALLPALGHVGVSSFIILLFYVVSLGAIYRYEHRVPGPDASSEFVGAPVDMRGAARRFLVAAIVVVGAALVLPFVGDRIAGVMGWEETFVGTLFLAIVTTLPEMAVTVGAIRLGQIDLAIGDLLGSNLFNVATICFSDIAYAPGPILAHVSSFHAVSAISAMMMTGIVISGLLFRPRTRVLGTVGWVSFFLLMTYLLNVTALYLYGE